MQLLKCKKCGWEGILIEAESGIVYDDAPAYAVTCMCPDASPVYFETEQEAGMEWNRRCSAQ